MKPRIQISGASVIGPAHLSQKLPNQDYYAYKTIKNGFIAVVADGLGSKKYSHIGSRAVCSAVIKAADAWLKESVYKSEKIILKLVYAYWELLIQGYKKEDCGTTCLFAVCQHDDLFLFQLGDGLIAHKSEQNFYIHSASDKDFGNMTDSMHVAGKMENWHIAKIKVCGKNRLLLATDGVSEDLIADKIPDFNEYIHSNIAGKSREKRDLFLNKMLKNWPTPKHTDDKTVLVIDFEVNNV